MEGHIYGEELRPNIAARLLIVFPETRRPDRRAIFDAVARSEQFLVSHDPGEPMERDGNTGAWLELLMDGLTFDCMGLQPGPPMQRAEPRHVFQIGNRNFAACEAIALTPGPHLAGAENTVPVVRTIVSLAFQLCEHLEDAIAVQWEPSACLIGNNYFKEVSERWLEGGPFPALGLSGIAVAENGLLRSDGLAFFTGQELELTEQLSADRVSASQLMVRLIDRLVMWGRVQETSEVAGGDGGPLLLTPSVDGKTVSVRLK